jgi:hypothetical protein
LTATIHSAGGIPTGQIEFHDGNTDLGTVPLDDTGVAVLRNNSLAAGVHSLTASYAGDGKFDASTSAAVTIDIANPDFSLGASPSIENVIAGHSTQFMLTVTPAGGFASNVTFSCAPVTGITCAFNPATVNPGSGAANTTLTVTASVNFLHAGLVMPGLAGPWTILVAFALFSFAMLRSGRLRTAHASLLRATAAVAIVALSITLSSCGGSASSTPSNRGTALIQVTAQSGAISHTTTVSVTVQ